MKKSNGWAWIYGDECDFLWEHFGFIMTDRDPKDRIKVKLISYETAEEQEAEGNELVA
tara:strand:- start:935 stop:1108 length:174 start_codon:yes stop_codon:yes gene_type:complete